MALPFHPQPKPIPTVIRRQRRRAEKLDEETKAKAAVWLRDGARSRASGKPVLRAHIDNRRRGEVAHLPGQSRAQQPGDKWNPKRLVLLTAEEHALSDARTANAIGKVLLEIRGRNANRKLTFIRRDVDGKELWRRETWPPGQGA